MNTATTSYSEGYPFRDNYAVPLRQKPISYIFIILPLTIATFLFIGLSIVWQRNLVFYEDSEIEHLTRLSNKIAIENKQLKKEILEHSTFTYMQGIARNDLGLEIIPISKKHLIKPVRIGGR
jgi:hypothetical protein